MSNPNFAHTVLRVGQPRPYADSVFEAEVTVVTEQVVTEAEVLEYCQTIRKALPKSQKCGDNWWKPLYTLTKLVDKKWRYTVVQEYTG